jgi:hypothetical protein
MSAFRTMSEMIFPAVVFCLDAKSLAAVSTSSSISGVVRMVSIIASEGSSSGHCSTNSGVMDAAFLGGNRNPFRYSGSAAIPRAGSLAACTSSSCVVCMSNVIHVVRVKAAVHRCRTFLTRAYSWNTRKTGVNNNQHIEAVTARKYSSRTGTPLTPASCHASAPASPPSSRATSQARAPAAGASCAA